MNHNCAESLNSVVGQGRNDRKNFSYIKSLEKDKLIVLLHKQQGLMVSYGVLIRKSESSSEEESHVFQTKFSYEVNVSANDIYFKANIMW